MYLIIAFVIWAVVHSIMASAGFKRLIRGLVGQRLYDGLYRFFYNTFAVITFLPILYYLIASVPYLVLWRITQPWSLLFIALQVMGLVGLLISLLQTDLLRFAGVGQAVRFVRGEEVINPPPVMVTKGTYGLTRHPLYFFGLLVLWFFPVMTFGLFLLNVLATIYFWVGSIFEERKLAENFGDAYRDYQRQVPRLIPIKLF